MIVYCIVRKRTREEYETGWSFGEARQWHTRLETMCVRVQPSSPPACVCQKGNENQFRFCEDVEEQLQSAASSISRAEKGAGKEALSRAKNVVGRSPTFAYWREGRATPNYKER